MITVYDAQGRVKLDPQVPSFCGARYSTDAGQSIPNNAAAVIINFEDVDYDTDSAVTIGAAWKFTAPATGYYHLDCFILFSTTTGWAQGERGHLAVYKNGVSLAVLSRNDYEGNPGYMPLSGSTTVHLTINDYIDIRVQQNSGAALALLTDATFCYVNIEKVG